MIIVALIILYLGFVVVGSIAFVVVGSIALVVAIIVWIGQTQTQQYSVSINTASGEEQALTSQDSQFISQVVNAINEAIVYRG